MAGQKYPILIIARLEKCTLEQVWGYLNTKGYRNQVETGWIVLKPGDVMVGRVVTAQFTPARPDLDSLVKALGKAEGRSQTGGTNLWPIDILTKGDIYVADGYLKVKDGTLIGSSLGNAIYGKSGNGVIFYGSIRDMQELKETEGFNAWIRGHDPAFIKDMTPVSINTPIRIGSVTVFPGDIAFANDYGVAFIPAQLCEGLVIESEITALRDEFEREMLQSGKYVTGEFMVPGVRKSKVNSGHGSLNIQRKQPLPLLRLIVILRSCLISLKLKKVSLILLLRLLKIVKDIYWKFFITVYFNF